MCVSDMHVWWMAEIINQLIDYKSAILARKETSLCLWRPMLRSQSPKDVTFWGIELVGGLHTHTNTHTLSFDKIKSSIYAVSGSASPRWLCVCAFDHVTASLPDSLWHVYVYWVRACSGLSPRSYYLLSAPSVCCDHSHTAVLSDTAADANVPVTAWSH